MERWIIPVVAIIGGLLIAAFTRYLKYKETTGQAAQGHINNLEGRIRTLEAELSASKAIEQRVRVLESIVTDSRYQLEQELKTLK